MIGQIHLVYVYTCTADGRAKIQIYRFISNVLAEHRRGGERGGGMSETKQVPMKADTGTLQSKITVIWTSIKLTLVLYVDTHTHTPHRPQKRRHLQYFIHVYCVRVHLNHA